MGPARGGLTRLRQWLTDCDGGHDDGETGAMRFTNEITEEGVTERRFELEVAGEAVPGILWVPGEAAGSRPKVLIGHGGTQHKRTANVLALARQLVRHLGYAAVAIDAPGHGDRQTAEERERAAELRRAILHGPRPGAPAPGAGPPTDPFPARFLQAVEEWRATIDAVERLEEVGTGPTGYWGVSMGTSIGLPLSATEPRVTAAVLGLASLTPRPGREEYIGWARQLSKPLLFLSQADDAGHPFELAVELFDLFGSAEKTMHVNPGPHVGIPAFERAEVEAFFRRHLGAAG